MWLKISTNWGECFQALIWRLGVSWSFGIAGSMLWLIYVPLGPCHSETTEVKLVNWSGHVMWRIKPRPCICKAWAHNPCAVSLSPYCTIVNFPQNMSPCLPQSQHRPVTSSECPKAPIPPLKKITGVKAFLRSENCEERGQSFGQGSVLLGPQLLLG